jgi:hypothetical protein
MYAVTFKNPSLGEDTYTFPETFESARKAKNVAKWVALQSWSTEVRTMNQIGGMEVT